MNKKNSWIIISIITLILILPFLSFCGINEIFGEGIFYYSFQLLTCFSLVVTKKTKWYKWILSQFAMLLILIILVWIEQYTPDRLVVFNRGERGVVAALAVYFINSCVQGVALIAAVITRSVVQKKEIVTFGSRINPHPRNLQISRQQRT